MKTQMMIATIALSMIAASMTSCKKDKKSNRTPGICYCTFYSGSSSQYDLQHLSRQNQIDTCYMHSTNAGAFGGDCELE